jgi:hypothetical protein
LAARYAQQCQDPNTDESDFAPPSETHPQNPSSSSQQFSYAPGIGTSLERST